ncbi:GFA family protein [Pseudomonas sp. TTU2014-080ASC]|uniref:GFA family protein n=1 Tax=Pseudomonas sp. TTU2014-080ASC TaxID=1729724 RepID=UPI0009E78BE7|nr:GFA family protein [Pseudomonas sp. TTU2014-080ASC]
MPNTYEGGCQCEAVRYQFTGVLRDIAHCHCATCRRTTGGIVTTWLTTQRADFRWLKGKPKLYASSATCSRYFCGDCGAQLALFTTLSPDSLDITVATLDHPEQATADRHIWVQSRLPWIHLDPHLPEEQQERIE